VNVGVVFHALEPWAGGGATFQRTVLDGIRAAAPSSGHTFRFYSVDGAPEPGIRVVPRNGVTRARQLAVNLTREVFDHVGVRRPPFRTPLETALGEDGVEVVWFASPYAERCELPYVFTVLDLEHLKQPWFPEVGGQGQWELRRYYFERHLPKAARVIAAGETGAAEVERFYRVPRDRILPLRHPTPPFALDAWEPQPEALARLGIEPPYLLYPAQFWAHKNHAVLFDMLALLPVQYRLVLVGSDKGILSHVRGLAARAGVAERVVFLGFVSQDDLVALYTHAHAMTYASWFGPENLPPLEAFALGCPVIAADVPGVAEQLEGAAVLIAPNDGSGFADAVRLLQREELRRELVERGRRVAAARTVEDYICPVLEFFDEFELIRRSWP
jgi:glycosyltransferase involved in cell wall biosynthesis